MRVMDLSVIKQALLLAFKKKSISGKCSQQQPPPPLQNVHPEGAKITEQIMKITVEITLLYC